MRGFNYTYEEKSGWIEVENRYYDNSYILSELEKFYTDDIINKDLLGRLKKIFRFSEKYNMISCNTKVLNKESRAGKINNFLGKISTDDSILAKVKIISYRYEVNIDIVKNKKGINNICTITKDNELYKKMDINKFDDDFRMISNLIYRDSFDLDFLKGTLLSQNSQTERKTIDAIFNSEIKTFKNVKWSGGTVRIDDEYCTMTLLIKKKKTTIEYIVKYYTTIIQSITVYNYKNINKAPTQMKKYSNLSEVLDEYDINYL